MRLALLASAALAAALLSATAQATGTGAHSHGPGHGAAGSEIGGPGRPKQATRTVRIVARDDMKYRPESITVRRGETVRIVLRDEGAVIHELALGTADELKEHAAAMVQNPEMEHEEPNMLSVQPGQSKELVWKFTKVGEVPFACLHPGHYDNGMIGKVIVKP
ncbi:MAG: hypothetical protein FJX68_06380 [Alphaproteobacteria bacterium]|nr:hypothetical protein [Alphaproteobacteria bacterium]